MYETGQLSLVKDATLAGTDDFCQRVFNDNEQGLSKSFGQVLILSLYSILKCFPNCFDISSFDLFLYFVHVRLHDLGILGSYHDP